MKCLLYYSLLSMLSVSNIILYYLSTVNIDLHHEVFFIKKIRKIGIISNLTKYNLVRFMLNSFYASYSYLFNFL
jgi:hypothetical protein